MIDNEQRELHLTLEDSISVLRNMKRRTREYGEIYGYMGEEYCRRLAEVERLAIDNVILALEMGAEMVDPPPKQPPAMPISVPVVTSLDEASAVMTPKEIYARCRAEKPEWRISEGAIRNWAKTGQLPCMRSGNRILIGWSTFCTFVANGTAQVSPEVAAAEAAAIDRASKGIPTPQEISVTLRKMPLAMSISWFSRYEPSLKRCTCTAMVLSPL